MNRDKLHAELLTPGATISVAGQVRQSRITSVLTKDELDRTNRKRRHKIYRPCTLLTLSDVEILVPGFDAKHTPDIDNDSPEIIFAHYIRDRCFYFRQSPEHGLIYQSVDKSQKLPEIFEKFDEDDEIPDDDEELHIGAPVHVTLEVVECGRRRKHQFNAVRLTEVYVEGDPI